MRSRSSRGSYSTLIECRSTMQKNASPCSCVCGVLTEAARVVAEVLCARRLDAGEDAHRGIVPGPAASVVLSTRLASMDARRIAGAPRVSARRARAHARLDGHRGSRAPDRRRLLRADRRAVHGRDARADPRDRARRGRGRRDCAPRRSVQATLVAVCVPGPRLEGPRDPRRGARGDRTADRDRAPRSRATSRRWPRSPTSSRSAPGTCTTSTSSPRSAAFRIRCCSSARRPRRSRSSSWRPSTSRRRETSA